jgi:hypothetical protein
MSASAVPVPPRVAVRAPAMVFNSRRTRAAEIEFADDLTLAPEAIRARPSPEDDEPGSQGEDRIVGKGGAQPLGSILIPVSAHGGEQ